MTKSKRYDYMQAIADAEFRGYDAWDRERLVRRVLRKLVREAIERSGLGWPEQRDIVTPRVAKELVP